MNGNHFIASLCILVGVISSYANGHLVLEEGSFLRMNGNHFIASVCILVGVISSYANGHLVLVNDNPVKQLTPAEPHEVDSFVHTLRRYAEETLGSGAARQENVVAAFKNSTNPCRNCTTEQDYRNYLALHSAGLKKELGEYGGPTMGLASILHDTLHSLLKAFEDNSSRPALFKTNFASTEQEETNL